MIKQIVMLAFTVLMVISINAQQIEKVNDINAKIASTKTLNWNFDSDTSTNAIKFLASIISYSQNNETGEWDKKNFRRRFSYDENMNDTLVLYSRIEENTNEWVDQAKVTRKYNAENKTLTQENIIFERSRTRFEETFNDDHKTIQMVNSRWNYNMSEWLHISKNRYSYNTDGTLQSDSLYIMYSISGTKMWKLVGKTEYTYDTEGKLVEDITYQQNWTDENTSDGWHFVNNKTYTYTPEGEIKEFMHYVWHPDSAQVIPHKRELTTYYTDKHTIYSFHKFDWDQDLNQWKETELKQYDNFENGFPEKCYTEIYGNTPSTSFQLFTYNYDLNKDQLILPTIGLNANETALFHHLIDKKFDYRADNETNTSTKTLESDYFYEDVETMNINDLEAGAGVRIYPNPASEYVLVRFNKKDNVLFKLYDINGKCLLTKNIKSNERINVSTLPSGFYIFSLIANGNKATGKLVKE
ncbi:MAG: hypothetical protein CL613_02670 [Aquimarina sp.]|nr:hypothetical protein [Aquimarina sp.]